MFQNLIKKKGNVIADEKIAQFNQIKRITNRKKLKLITLNDKKNNFKIISHRYKGDSQILKIEYKKSQLNLMLIYRENSNKKFINGDYCSEQ